MNVRKSIVALFGALLIVATSLDLHAVKRRGPSMPLPRKPTSHAPVKVSRKPAKAAIRALLDNVRTHIGLDKFNSIALTTGDQELLDGINGFLTNFAALAAAAAGDLPTDCKFDPAAKEATMKFATSIAAGGKFGTAKAAATALKNALKLETDKIKKGAKKLAVDSVEASTKAGGALLTAANAFIAAFDAAVAKADPKTGLKAWLGANADAANLLTDTLASDANMKTGGKYSFNWPTEVIDWTAPSNIENARAAVVADISANATTFKNAILANLQAAAKNKSGDISAVPTDNDAWLMDTPNKNGVAADNALRTAAFGIADATHKVTTKVFAATDTAVTYGTAVHNLKTKAELVAALVAAYTALVPATDFQFAGAGKLNNATITNAFNNPAMTTWLGTPTATDNAKNTAAHTACQAARTTITDAANAITTNVTVANIHTDGSCTTKITVHNAINDAHTTLEVAITAVATAKAHVAGANPITAILDAGFSALSIANQTTAINAAKAYLTGKTAAEAVAILAQLSAGSVSINVGGVITAVASAGYAGLNPAVKDAFLEVAAQAEANGQINNAVLTAIAAW